MSTQRICTAALYCTLLHFTALCCIPSVVPYVRVIIQKQCRTQRHACSCTKVTHCASAGEIEIPSLILPRSAQAEHQVRIVDHLHRARCVFPCFFPLLLPQFFAVFLPSSPSTPSYTRHKQPIFRMRRPQTHVSRNLTREWFYFSHFCHQIRAGYLYPSGCVRSTHELDLTSSSMRCSIVM